MQKYIGFKTCVECHRELQVTKFHRHPAEPDGFMSHCKACHNGCFETIERLRSAAIERQLGDPSEEQIAAACAAFQAKWSDEERIKRRERPWFARKVGLA